MVKFRVNRVEILQIIEGHTTERFKIELRIGNQCLRQFVLLSFALPFPSSRLHCFAAGIGLRGVYYGNREFMVFFLLTLLSNYLNQYRSIVSS